MIQNVVVQQGSSLFSLAQKFGTTTQSIISLNNLRPTDTLVVGQTILINTENRMYYVQPGDTLFHIALTYNTTAVNIARASNISSNAQLQVGQILYIPTAPKKSIEVNAYLQPTTIPISQTLVNATSEAAPSLTYLAPFSFEARASGTLVEPSITGILDIATANRVIPMLVVSNIDESGGFSPTLAETLFTNNQAQNNLINNILATAQKYGMTDIHFDFENLRPNQRTSYNNLLWNMKGRLPSGYTLSTTLVPKTSDTMTTGVYAAHDYATHGQVADFVIIMTYDWGWQGGPPQAISPINSVRRVINYAKTKMPTNKIMMGQNLYGFDWLLPFAPRNPPATAVSSVGAVDLARRFNVPIRFNSTVSAPYFRYFDANGRQHEVWFEDNRSIQNKFNLVKQTGIRGISYWKLGLPFPQNWRLLRENFQITKKR